MKKLQFILTGLCLLITLPLLADNYSLNFDGDDDYVDCGQPQYDNLGSSDYFTIEFYVKVDGINQGRIFSYFPSSGDDSFALQCTYWDGDIGVNYSRSVGGPNAPYVAVVFNNVVLNQWYHIKSVYNNGILELFVDENLVDNSIYYGGEASSGINSTLLFGMLGLEPNERFSGLLDNLKIIGEIETDIIGYWNFNEGTGNIAYDSTINGNNGTIYGATWSTDVPPAIMFPWLLSPYNNSGNISTDTEFIWTEVDSAASYQIQVSPDSSFYTTTIDEIVISDTTYSATGLSNLTDYYWKVRAMSITDTSYWSETFSFITEYDDNEYSLSFDGIDDYVDCGDILNDLVLPASFQIYFKLNSSETKTLFITDNGNGTNYNGYWINASTSKIAVSYGDGEWAGNGERRSGLADVDLTLDVWYSITCVVRGPQDMSIYLNDTSLDVTYEGSGGDIHYTTDPFKIGVRHSVTHDPIYFDGLLDELRIWDIALNATQVESNYNISLNGDETGLVAYWKFNEGTGSTLYDSTINSNNGSIYGATWSTDSPFNITADFTADQISGYVPLTVNFIDQSTTPDSIVSWEWDFDNDGTIDSYAQNPQWIYTDPGIYTVSLTVSDGSSKATDTEIKEDYITVYEEQNYSVNFDYMDGYASSDASSQTIFQDVSSFSVEVWYKNPGIVSGPNSGYTSWGAIITNYRRLGGGDPYNNFALYMHSNVQPNPGKVSFLGALSNEQLDDDEWHHIAGVYDNDNGIAYLFVDGVLNDSNNASDDFLSSYNKLYINNWAPFAGESHMDCDVAAVRITDGVRYQSNFNPSFPLTPENNSIVALGFCAGGGTVLNDLSVNGNNFTLYDGYTWNTDVPPIEQEMLSLPTDVSGAPGSSVSIPLTFNNTDSVGIEGIEATISFDETILGFMSATLSGGVLENENYSIQANAISDSVISIWIYANGELFNGEGVIAFIAFNVDPNANCGQTTVLEFTQSVLNENPINADNGLFTVAMNASLSLPTDISASNGDSVSIPLILENPDCIGLEGIETTISFDETILNPIGATLTGGVLENQNYGIQINIVGDTLLTIWIYANGDLFTGDGIISFLNFEVDPNAINGQTSDLNFTFAEINEYPVDTTNGLFTVVGIYDIFGNIVYFSNDNPIEHTLVNFDNSKYQVFTDPDGDYEFLEIPYGNYISFASKGDDLGGLSSMDASRIARYGVGLYSLTDYEIIAADVSLNATVSPLDASRVARYGVGLIDELNDDNIHWVFAADSVNSSSWPPIYYETFKYYTPLNTDMTNEDFVGVRLGDVTGNWAPSKKKSIEGTKDISAILPEVTGAPTDTVTVTLDVFGLENLEGMDITITFNEQVIDALDATINGGILENENFGYQVNTNNDNEIILWIYALGDPYSGSGTVAFIDFEVVGEIDDSTDIAFTHFDVNEVDFLNNTEDGSLVVTSYSINEIDIPKEIFLGQNYPNPVKSNTEIYFGLTKKSEVDINIYNLKGQLIEMVIQGSFDPGYHSVNYSIKNLPNGIYFYKMSVDGVDKEIRKMVLLK